MDRLRVVLVLAALPLLPGCRSSFEEVDNRAYPQCQQCLEEGGCADAKAACEADPTCVNCIETPFSLSCASNENWVALAGCSCFQCSGECEHTCPAGFGACQSCGLSSCPDETQACIGDSTCTGCLDNPAGEGCAESAAFQAFLGCGCEECGQECLWSCPDAFSECGACALGGCGDIYSQCLADEICSSCSDNPSAPECEMNELSVQVQACVCENCVGTCDKLFQCDG